MSLEHILAQLSQERRVADVFDGLMRNDEILEREGFPPISPFWRDHLRDFYRSGKRRFVARVGRRGGKSSTMCRAVAAEIMYGAHPVTPGDVGVYVIVSVRQKDANARLVNIKEILSALGVGHKQRKDEIELRDKPIVVRSMPANFRTIVGMTCIGIVADECARWQDDDYGANPAKEVLRSLRPAMATMPRAKEFMISSPWAQSDAHFDHVEMGNTDQQMVVKGTTWECNPTLTREGCLLLEPDEPTFKREYEAIPMTSGASQFFDGAAIDACMRPMSLPNFASPGESTTVGADFAFKSDWSSIVVCHNRGGVYRVGDIEIQKPSSILPLKPSEVCSAFARVCRRHKTRAVMADGHYRESVVEHLGRHGISFMDAPRRPADVFVRARSLMYQGLVELPQDEDLKSRMLLVESRPTPNGAISIRMPRRRDGGGHGDDISALVLALWQRKGMLAEEPKPSGMPPERLDEVRPGWVQDGWTKEEMDDVRRLSRAFRKDERSSYIKGL